MSKRLTNEHIDSKLEGRNIKKIGDYVNNKTPIEFLCLKTGCGHNWFARPDCVVTGNKNGCPECSYKSKFLTNEERGIKKSKNSCQATPGWGKRVDNTFFDQKLENKLLPITRISDYITARTKINFQCKKCSNIWTSTPDNILRGKKCPQCSRTNSTNIRKSNIEEIDFQLEKLNIERRSNYINTNTPIIFQCIKNDCRYIWKTKPSHILHSESGCPNCSLGKNENITRSTLNELYSNLESQKYIRFINDTNKNIRVDFYLPQHNTIIEYNGHQHYQPVCFGGINEEMAKQNFIKQQERDYYLDKWCKLNYIKLIWIDGRKYTNNKLEKFIREELISEIGVGI